MVNRRSPKPKPELPRAGDKLGDWSVTGPLGGSGFSFDHVVRVRHLDGRTGILKVPKGLGWYVRRRLADEATGSRGLTIEGFRGSVPVLDIDPSAEPSWMVMAEAVPLAKHLATVDYDFRSVVAAIAEIAHHLDALHSRPDAIVHRDIKPDNLFWFDDHAVVGDLGISTWPKTTPLTKAGRQVGPAMFIAPEARSYNDRHPPGPRADVFSLAESLWFLCARETLPPQGPMFVHRTEASLHEYGGQASQSLRYWFERATANDPYERPRMSVFASELDRWLAQYPPGSRELDPFPRSIIKMWPGYVSLPEWEWKDGPEKRLRTLARQLAARIVRGLGSGAKRLNKKKRAGFRILGDTSTLWPDHEDYEVGAFKLEVVDLGNRVIVLGVVMDNWRLIMIAELQDYSGENAELKERAVSQSWFGFPSETDAIRSIEAWWSSVSAPEAAPGDEVQS